MFVCFHISVLNRGWLVVVAACAGVGADADGFTVAGDAVTASLSQ
jgi:hypothetical protein